MIASIIFYVVVAVQLWLISHFYANRVTKNMQHVSDNYSEQEYPKLYPKSKSHYLRIQKLFKVANRTVLSLGILALSVLIYGDITEGYKPPNVAAAIIFMLQLAPFGLLELTEYNYFNEMRKQLHKPTRTSSLSRRSLTNYLTPIQLWLGVILMVVAITSDLLVHQAEEPFLLGMNESALYRSITLVVCNLLMLGIALKNIFGKKPDPFQHDDDRQYQTQQTVVTLFYLCLCISFFFLLKSVLIGTGAEGFEAVATAIYSIVIAYVSVGHRVRCINLTKIDFNAYKA
ncbi:hypothetical protein HII17_00115 [Thalassotalea sp. M1531]|uniref:Uncharacterized protein n=1 Tax=Thalassotalea algicola TaxID=2716224 RepID=A0A7Y0L999_9GAMM|nr:hypothetical protein [Thalassotalea algicola]NMP29948.1 hypothetical protein [Thalassotalea algicola]